MKCALCGAADAACKGGHSLAGAPVDIPGRAVMASQGPLVRVDTGRRHYIKMTAKDAAAWAAAHPAPVVAVEPEPTPELQVMAAAVVEERPDDADEGEAIGGFEDEPKPEEPKKPAAGRGARKPAARKS